MGNHYHFILQTRQANLSMPMHRINSVYSLSFNRRHGMSGPLFEARFKAAHVDRDRYLLQACRYVDLTPVRAGLVVTPGQWAWSSYCAHSGSKPAPAWLATAGLHGVLMGALAEDDLKVDTAQRRYADWVEAGRGVRLWDKALGGGRFLGDESFVQRVMNQAR